MALLFVWQALWLRLLDSALLAFAFVQLAYIFHDAGHRQIFGRSRQNDLVMLLVGLLVGSSRSWWYETHNLHHSNPNDLDLDPNTALPILNFSEQQAGNRKGFLSRLTRFQAYYFFPMLALEGVGARVASLQFLVKGNARYRLVESIGMALHLVLYVGLLFAVMPVGQAVLFMLVHQGLAGLYMGSVFAPNHKGMLVPDAASRLDFFHRQVLSSRNIAPNPLVDTWYGGLNYQIEHHLFPTMPRNKLKAARLVVKEYCCERAIPYYETSIWQSYTEIARYLHRAVAPLRAERPKLAELREPFRAASGLRKEDSSVGKSA